MSQLCKNTLPSDDALIDKVDSGVASGSGLEVSQKLVEIIRRLDRLLTVTKEEVTELREDNQDFGARFRAIRAAMDMSNSGGYAEIEKSKPTSPLKNS